MRKPFFCLWIGFLLLLCCCSAPAPREPYAMEQTEAAAEPPEILSFPDMEALAAFFDSVSLSDEAFAAYLTENSLDLNGISSKQDVMDLIAQLDGVPFPTVADAGAADIAIYPSYGQFHVQYLTEAGEFCGFSVHYQERTLEAQPLTFQYYDEARDLQILTGAVDGCWVVCRFRGTEAMAREVANEWTVFSDFPT